jgi:uncharacterized membrane protein YecN with MAPEG domain
MDSFMSITSVQAAALWTGLLILLMLALKLYVGGQRRKHKVPSGDLTHPEFGRATRIQLNAVEDVPPLMVGILALALLNMPAWYVHVCGGVLFVSRVLHAWGLSTSSGFSLGRLVGTIGTILVTIFIAGALIVHALHLV